MTSLNRLWPKRTKRRTEPNALMYVIAGGLAVAIKPDSKTKHEAGQQCCRPSGFSKGKLAPAKEIDGLRIAEHSMHYLRLLDRTGAKTCWRCDIDNQI